MVGIVVSGPSTSTSYTAAADSYASPITLTANTPTDGLISKLIKLKNTTQYDRPWISWVDEADRHRVGIGYHGTNKSDEAQHVAFEVKTSTDPAGAIPTTMRTRMSIGTNADRTPVTFPFVTFVEAMQGEHVAATQFGFRLRAHRADGAAHFVLGTFTGQVEASDNCTVFQDVFAPAASNAHTWTFFRATNTSSSTSPVMRWKRGNNSNTDALALFCGGSNSSSTLIPTFTFHDGFNFIVGTSVGLKIGTSATQKLGAFGATPIVRPTGVAVTAEGIHAALVSLGWIAA